MDPVNLDTNVQPPNPVNLDLGTDTTPPSAPVAANRAYKTSVGLGKYIDQSEPELYNAYMQGQEQNIRNRAAELKDMENEGNRRQSIINSAQQAGQTLSIEDWEKMQQQPTDPNSVVEDGYSGAFLNNIYKSMVNFGGWDAVKAMEVVPEVVSKDIDNAVGAMSNREYAVRGVEDLQDTVSSQGIVPWALDQAKSLVPFYNDVKLRGWMEHTSAVQGVLLGNNLYDQTRELLRLPGPQFRDKYDQIKNSLANDNPALALYWANAVVGMSSGEQLLANINNVIDTTAVPGIAKGAMSVLRGVNTVRKGLTDAIRESATVNPVKGAAAEGFGDTATAAVEKSADDAVQRMTGQPKPSGTGVDVNAVNDPIQRAQQTLPTGFQLDRNKLKSNPGPLSRELMNRLEEQSYTNEFNVMDAIANVAKVQRISLEEASTQVYTALKDSVRNQYPGLKNAIADIGDPVWNPYGNNYNFPVRIFAETGEQFSSEEVARRFASEKGILEYELKGKPGATHYIPEAAIKRSWETTPRLGAVTYKNGELRVFTDDGAEVATTITPQAGHVPIEVRPDGTVKFHPTLKSDEEVAKAVIQQQGLGFHLITWKPLDETQFVIKDLMSRLDSTKSIASNDGIRGWVNSIPFIGYTRTSEATLSPFEVRQRNIANDSVSVYHKLLQEQMKYVEDVARGRVRIDEATGQPVNAVWSYIKTLNPITKFNNRQIYNEFSRALDLGRFTPNEATGKLGKFAENPAELYQIYHTNFQRDPTFREVQGYFAFTRNYENDRVFRSLREYTNKVRLGAEQHQVTFKDNLGNTTPSGFFEGIIHRTLPGGEDPILLLHDGHNDIRLTSKIGGTYKDLDKEVKTGKYTVIELYNPELRPLKDIPGVGRNYIRYVLADSAETKGLDWNQVNKLGGGHFEYNYSHYIKEAKIEATHAGSTTIHRYEGDRTFMPVANQAQGRAIVRVLNMVKHHLKENDIDKARDVFENGLRGEHGPAMEWKDFYSQTQPAKDGTVGVDIHEPYRVVPKGKSILDLDDALRNRYGKLNEQGQWQSTFKDGTKSGSLARQYQVAYTTERDSEALKTLNAYGTKNNPIYKYEPAEFVDPIQTMNRALNQISSQSFMDDMKIAGVESWLREAERYLKAPDINDIRSSPWWYFHNSNNEKAFTAAADRQTVSNLLSNRFKTMQFIGIPSRYDIFMHDTAQKLADFSYDKLGPSGSKLVPTWLLNHTKSPVQMLRSLAYHTKMGLFAFPQLLTQSQTYLTIAAIAPRSAVSGTVGAMLHQWSKFSRDPAFLSRLDNIATHMQIPGFHTWKPGEFLEAMREMNNRGFANYGSTSNALKTQLKHSFVKSEFDSFLDLGQMFFNAADQNVKYGAWYTAYKEYRALKPELGTLARTDWDKIHTRANALSGSMTRASASIMQSGPLGLFNQFLTYQTHLAEFFWGKNIETEGSTVFQRSLARARMYGMYATMFGLPGAIGVTGLPATQTFRQYAIDNGYVVGDKWIQSMMVEGLPAAFLAWMTSDKDKKNGNWYNINDKLGAGGLTQFNEILNSDPKWWTLIGGASTSIAANTMNNARGWVRSNWSMMTGKQGDEAFPAKIDDWTDIFKEISSVNQIQKMITGVAFGKWLSKNELYQADVSKANAIFMGLTGLNLQNSGDNYIIGLDLAAQKDSEKQGLNRFIREFHRGITSANNNDYPSYKQYMTRAYTLLKAYEYPIDKYATAISIASKGYETQIDSIREEFYTKNVPQGKEPMRYDAYQRFLKTTR
jgi:hypothetical protein